MTEKKGMTVEELSEIVDTQKEPTNQISKIKLKELKEYLEQTKTLIKANEDQKLALNEQGDNLNKTMEKLQEDEKKLQQQAHNINAWKVNLETLEKRLELSADQVALNAAIAIVPNSFFGFPRNTIKVWKDVYLLKEKILNELVIKEPQVEALQPIIQKKEVKKTTEKNDENPEEEIKEITK